MINCIDLVRPHLGAVEKPQRYLGNELNQIKKDKGATRCDLLFCFPDIYDVGMSNLGLHIFYDIVNSRDGLSMERAFSPWPDMELIMNREGIPLYGLESGSPAASFDCLGFTLQHEMCYTNVLQMLKLAGLPFYAADRADDAPMILAGGPCGANPEPVAPFFDLIFLGEGEELLPEIMEVIAGHKQSRSGKADKPVLLSELSVLPGVYIPAMGRRLVKRVHISDLDKAPFPLKPIVPYIEVIHDRMMLEIQRGCTRGCRFCQAGMIYRPVRERDKETLLSQAKTLRDNTGHREISLTSLSSTDHSRVKELIEELCAVFADDKISVSLPSLRADKFSVALAMELQKVRKTGLTFAPEAGSQRLRDAINKGVEEAEFLESVEMAVASGWRQIKLYFMVGLPGETMDDIDAIAALCEKVVHTGNRIMKEQGRSGGFNVTCAVSNFVPKARTPFQWLWQARREELAQKHQRLKLMTKSRRVSLSFHDSFTSALEAVFARGDRDLAPVVVNAFEKGCRFDSWTEHMRRDRWIEAFDEAGMDINELAGKSYDLNDPLPWDHLDYGVSSGFLKTEYIKSLKGAKSPDCRGGVCAGCGVCGKSDGRDDDGRGSDDALRESSALGGGA
jgi:radical SAM superfamily enzyme YgiQ (UPF0313 family)